MFRKLGPNQSNLSTWHKNLMVIERLLGSGLSRLGYTISIALLALLFVGAVVALAEGPAAPENSPPPIDAPAASAYNTVITVTTTADPDDDQQYVCYAEGLTGKTPRSPCTLRQALEESHTLDPSAGPILIQFNLPITESHDGAGDYWVIQLAETGQLNALPDVGDQTTIDGSTQTGGRSDGPKIIVRGPEKVPNGYGLVLEESSVVRGIAFQRLRMHIQLNGSDNTVEDCWFGLTDDGQDVFLRDEEHPEDGSGQSGVSTADNNSNNNRIQNNALTHFRAAAINVRGDNSFVLSNTVGTLADGTVPEVREDRKCKSNAFELNWFAGAGVNVSGHNNLVQNNRVVGMLFQSEDPFTTPDNALDISGHDHVVQDNIIGLTSDGVPFGVCGEGIHIGGIMGAHYLQIVDNHVVGSQGAAGIHVTGGPYGYDVDAVTVQGNVIEGSAHEAFKLGDTLPSELRNFEPAAITSFDGTNVTGTSGAGSPCANCTVELFLDVHDTVNETLESLAVVTADGSGNWNTTLGRTLALTEGLRTASTTAADGQIPHPSPPYSYHAGTTTKLSDIYTQSGAPEPTPPPDPAPLTPLAIPPITYAPPPTLPRTYTSTFTTVITVTTAGDPKEGNDWGDDICYDEYDISFYNPASPCSLRRAVLESDKIAAAYENGEIITNPFPILIRFNIPITDNYDAAGAYWTITLSDTGSLNALPYLGQQTAIVGETQPGGRSDGPKIVVRGPEKVPAGYGLIVDSDSYIQGLAFQRLRMHLQLNGGGNIVEENWFGLTADGLDIFLRDEEHPDDGSGQSGVTTVENVSGNLIQDNVLAGFRGGAIGLRSNDSFLWGNYVGVNAEGLVPVDVPASRWCKPNARYHNWFGGAGVTVSGRRCQIGGDTADKGNVIAAMLIYGNSPYATPPVALNLNRQDHLVQNNIIGMDLSGKEVGTCGDGIIIDAPRTRVVSNVVARSAALSMFSAGTRYNSNSRAMWGNTILDTAPKTGEFETLFDFGPGIPEELAIFTPTQVITFEADGVTVHGANGHPYAACPYCGVELFADDLDGISETVEALAVTSTDADGNWTATLSRPLLITEGLRTAITAMNYGTIPNYDANTTSRFSVIYRPAGAQDITPPTPTVKVPLPIPEISYMPPPTLPHNFTYNTILTVTTAGDPKAGNDWGDDICYDDYSLNFYVPESPCSLRRAVREAGVLAQERPEALPILIKFSIPVTDSYSSDYGGYWTIVLSDTGELDALPELGSQTVLDGDSQPGGRGDGPKIVIRGPENVPAGWGLRLYGDDNLVRGLAFQRLRMHMFVGGSGNVIENNWFGLSDDGLDIVLRNPDYPEDGSGQSGIRLAENTNNNLVLGNVLAGFRGGAMSIGSNDSYVQGNYVGVNAAGEIPVDITYNRVCKPNARYYNWFGGGGVDVTGKRNVIGGPGAADGNIFASMLIRGQDPYATPPDALSVYGRDHLVQNNLIGVDALGQDAGVCGNGLRLNSDFTRFISNTISQSGIYALYQSGTRYNSNARTLQGNRVWDSETLLEFDPGIPEPFQIFTPSKVTDITVGGGDTTVSGVNGENAPCPYCQVELFTDDLDETPELVESVAIVTADENGDWSVNLGRELAITEGLRTVITPWDYGIIEEFYEAGSTSRYSELYTQAGSTPPDPEPEPTPVPPRDAPPITYTTPPTEPVSYAMVVTVTTTADTSGYNCGAMCSLRQALNDVSAYERPRPALIAFDIPITDTNYTSTLGVWKITVGSSLPTVEDGQVTIDATTQQGYDGSRPVVILWRDSSTTIDLKLGTTQYDDNNIVRGLALQGIGIFSNGDNNIISHNWLGLTDDGTDIYYYSDNPNNRNNAIIEGAGGSGGHYIHLNVLAGSGTVAVDLEGNDNLVAENWVGLRADGTIDTSFPEANICDPTATTDNWLGGGGIDIAGYRNRVISNTIAGLLIKGSATSSPPDAIDIGFGEYSLVENNRIGVDATGAEVWTCGDGVSDVGSDFTRILSNTIVNSFGNGIYIDGNYWDSNANTVQGNVISNCIAAYTFGDTIPPELDLFSPAIVTLIDGVNVSGISDDDCPYCYVDVYLDDDDPWTEALAYWGRTTADVNGDWSLTLPRALTANEGLHTISTPRNYGVIRNYEIGSSSKLSALFQERDPLGLSNVGIITPTADPATGELWTNVDHYFVAQVSPVEATLPITYVWEATGLVSQTVHGGVEKAVPLNWDIPGTKVVQVTAYGYGGSSVVDTVTVEITERLPLRGVSIDGAEDGYTGLPYDFDAVLNPVDATEPITYTWSPEPDSGQGTGQATYQWAVSGTMLITVTAENYGGLFTGTHTIEIAQAPDCFAIEDVDLTLLTSGTIYTNTIVQFSADITPDYADPYTYTIDYGDGYSAPATTSDDPLTFNHVFTTPGGHTVSIGVGNCGMNAAAYEYDSVTFDVVGESAPCVAVTGVATDGPTTGNSDQDYTFNTILTPTGATAPINYTWSPAPDSGQGTDSATYRWSTGGDHILTLTVENCGTSTPIQDTHSINITITENDHFIYLPLVMRNN